MEIFCTRICTTATCNLCSSIFTYSGTTSNLRNHLRNKHPSTGKDDTPTKQTQMTTFISTPRKFTDDQKEKVTQAIAEMVVTDYLPLSVVHGKGFKKLMGLLAPNYTVPSRTTIRSRITKLHGEGKERLRSELQTATSASITTDTWTSTASESYMTITAHHINEEWEMESNVLLTRAMPERHTGENIANRLQECVSEFGLSDRVDACIHDNARNMESAGQMCEDWEDLGCFAHSLQLCVKPVLDMPAISKLVAKCRKLVGHFKHSTTLTAGLKDRQKLLEEPQHQLIQDVPTRWNSTQQMLERLTEQRRVITDIMLDTRVTKKTDAVLLPKDYEWELISELSRVLRDLTDVTTFISTESYVSSSNIYPIVCGLLRNSLREENGDNVLVAKAKETLRVEIDRRFQPTTVSAAKTLPAVAALLDPRYKRLQFFSREQRRTTHEALESRLDEIPLRLPARSDETAPGNSKRRRLDVLQFGSSENDESEDELQTYLMEKGDEETDPLTWWKLHESKYPRISRVAKKLLASPATSVPSERVFSAAGLIINKLRNRLSNDVVDGIIFLNKNNMFFDCEMEEC